MCESDQKITVNRARCRLCDDTITSKSVHHFVTCSCGNLSVDGGNHYLRRMARQGFDSAEELSECAGE